MFITLFHMDFVNFNIVKKGTLYLLIILMHSCMDLKVMCCAKMYRKCINDIMNLFSGCENPSKTPFFE